MDREKGRCGCHAFGRTRTKACEGPARFTLLLWIPIALVITADCWHAWTYRASLPLWEPSPLARGIFALGGIGLSIGLRALVMVLAFLAAILSPAWRERITWLYAGACALLVQPLLDRLREP